MDLVIEQVSAEYWKNLSELAHKVCFHEDRLPDEDRISFALICQKTDGTLLGYATCLETHNDTVYMQYGGAFPGARKTSVSFQGYKLFIEWCRARYKRILTYVSNKNKVMLKFAMSVGFEIVGVKYFKGFVLVDHALEVSVT